MGARFYGYYVVMSPIKIEHREPGSPHLCVVTQAFSPQNVQKSAIFGTSKKGLIMGKKGRFFLGTPVFCTFFAQPT